MSSEYFTQLKTEDLDDIAETSHGLTSRNHDSLLHNKLVSTSINSQVSPPTTEIDDPSGQFAKSIRETRKYNERLRERVMLTRDRLRFERHKLRRLEEAKANADDQFMRFVHKEGQSLMGNEESLTKLEELRLQCQRLRDSYGPCEDQYRQLEDELERLEDKLSHAEDRLYNHFNIMSSNDPFLKDGWETPSASSSSSSSATEYPPLLAEFLSNLGDLSLLKERYDLFVIDKEKLEDQREIRQRANLALQPADQQFLDDFLTNSSNLTREIEQLQRTCNILQKKCMDQGFLGVDSYPSSPSRTSRRNSSSSYKDQDEEHIPLAFKHGDTSMSTSQPTKHKLDTQLSESQVDRLGAIKVESQINNWMAEKLKSSVVESLLLAAIYLDIIGENVKEDWLEKALKHWWTDDTDRVLKQNRMIASSDWGSEVTEQISTLLPVVTNTSMASRRRAVEEPNVESRKLKFQSLTAEVKNDFSRPPLISLSRNFEDSKDEEWSTVSAPTMSDVSKISLLDNGVPQTWKSY